jgi:hypothetical protein
MAFRNYDRKLFAELESTEGTAAGITTAQDFIESVNPQFTITPLQFERQPKTMTFTGAPMTVPGTTKAAAVSMVEFTFAVELCGPGTAVASGTAPAFDDLLASCGLEKTNVFKYDVTDTSYATPGTFFNREGVEGTAGSYSSADAQCFGDNAFGDAEFLVTNGTTLGATSVKSQHSGTTVTATGTGTTQIGVGYRPKSANSEGNSSSCTIRLYLDKAGSYVEGVGCRGTFEVAFVHGDRALVNFTFQGVLNSYTEGSDPTDYTYDMQVPPAWINTSLEFGPAGVRAANYTGALFNAVSFTAGNELVLREDTNNAKGAKAAIITGRSPLLTFNPDMVLSSAYDFWDKFLSGDQSRMRWSIGSTAGNTVEFRVAAAQFTGIADGERDSVSILDSTTNLTGADYGSSLLSDEGTQTSTQLGADNEFVILFR